MQMSLHTHVHTQAHTVKNTAVTHTCFCRPDCVSASSDGSRRVLRKHTCAHTQTHTPFPVIYIHCCRNAHRVLQGCSVWRVSSAGVVLLQSTAGPVYSPSIKPSLPPIPSHFLCILLSHCCLPLPLFIPSISVINPPLSIAISHAPPHLC